MLPTFTILRTHLAEVIREKGDQGHVIDGLQAQLEATPDSYDALWSLARHVAALPLRPDWPHVEPSEWVDICREADPTRPTSPIANVPLAESAARVETAFLASVCGCVLGKPLEIHATMAELRPAFESTGDWPLKDYISEAIRPALPRNFHYSAPETLREKITFVSPDDDINYTLMGMLVLEKFGLQFTRQQLCGLWLHHLPIRTTFGPERTTLIKAGIDSYHGKATDADLHEWVTVLNPHEEWCGALIRADAYGYACPGNPALAAELAWRDSSFTHRRTGIYGTMFVAAAIAAAQTQPADRLEPFHIALQFIPQKSRFAQSVRESIAEVSSAKDWLDGYERVHRKYRPFGHCRIYQEIGTLINTLNFATDIADGFCKQVAQGNDTDSFGATSGSLLGCYFGPAQRPVLDRWLKPFNDDLHTALAWFFDRSLSAVAKRMSRLPQLVADELAGKRALAAAVEKPKQDAGAGV